MSMQIISLPPVSPWSEAPIADAFAAITAITGNPAFTQPQVRVWNDPNYTGRWQFEVSSEYEPSGDMTDAIILKCGCQGNSSTSIGGFPAAPAPNFTTVPEGVTMVGSPLFPFPKLPAMSSAGNAAVFRPQMLPMVDSLYEGVASNLLKQMNAIVSQAIGATGTLGTMYYWTDPRTGGTAGAWQGTGEWEVELSGWAASNAAFTSMRIGGCSITGLGLPPAIPIPLKWAFGATESGGVWYPSTTQVQVINRFAI